MTKPKCRVPWVNGTEWGGPDWESCPYPQAEGVWDDACIWKELTAAECAAKHGTRVSRAETLAECTRWKGCFHTTNHYITAISEGPCKDDQKCSVEDYEWRDVLDWRSGVWTPSTMVPREWKLREMAPRNKWGVLLSWSSIELLVNDAVYAILGRAYVNEALCMTEPVLQVFEPLSCACGKDRTDAANAEYCAAVKEKVHVSKIAEATSWKNIATRQVIKSAVGTTVPDIAALLGSGNGNQDKVDTFVSMLSAASQRLCLPRDTTSNNDGDPNPPGNNEATRRADTHPMRRFSRRNLGGLQNKCEQYEVVPNADGETVGQLIGNGMSIKGLKGGSVRTCLKKDPNIPLCLSKFEITDVAKGGADDKPGVPLQATVTTEGDRLCITVTLLETGEMTLYPILRTEDMKPYVAFVGTVVKAVMKLSIESKELFTLDVMKAFKVSIAKVLQNKGLSALKSKDVVIVKVCDDVHRVHERTARPLRRD
ncbi:hypothetical protein T484DRAFT_3066423 [Baffinella frigidus]|nr:hypothetical protein T484DRAFT_3066423 [Cryptophyta sp. CCMP2293]